MKNNYNYLIVIHSLLLFILLTAATATHADENALEVQKVGEGVYALVGKRGPMTGKDLGTNATFGVIVTRDGVVLIDPGASYKGAQRIHAAIETLTDRPVRYVINTGSEDHRWLGNGYFRRQGAEIIAAEAAVADQKERGNDLLNRLDFLLKADGAAGTEAVTATRTFADSLDLEVGGVKLQLRHLGPAYTPGDTIVWLPEQRIVFAGDIVAVERIPAIGAMSNTRGWINAFAKITALEPAWIVPGHGHVATLAQARADTLEYLQALRAGVGELIENGGTLDEVSKVDQSRFKRLIGFEMLKGRNAHQVFQEMEWE